MLADLTMIATLPVDAVAVQKLCEREVKAQQPDIPHPIPGTPNSPEQPIVPPDDPHRKDVDREPSIDPPSIEPPVEAPSEQPGFTEPPAPRA